MIFTPLATVVLASLVRFAYAQGEDIVYDAEHNATSIIGTWSTGSRNVVTGLGFANPAQLTFNYPATSGESHTFSDDGFFEVARYRYLSNPADPNCVSGVLLFCHGTYTLNSNGSITLEPFNDCYQQVQNPCAAVSNFIETYPVTELISAWRIFNDRVDGAKLHMFEHNGKPKAPHFLVSARPNMHPTQPLFNTSWVRVNSEKRSLPEDEEDDASSTIPTSPAHVGGVLAAVGAIVLALSPLLL